MNKYRKEYCEENGIVQINPENTKLYDYIKHLEIKLAKAEQLILSGVSKCTCDIPSNQTHFEDGKIKWTCFKCKKPN